MSGNIRRDEPMRRWRTVGYAPNTLTPGWLERVLSDAHIRVMLDSHLDRQRYADRYPISWDDGEALLAVMSARFESWTGRSIEDHIKARPPL